MGISNRIKQLIDNKGITAYVVSAKTGISQATLSRLLSNSTKKPNISNIDLLANYFEVNSGWLLTGEGEMLKTTSPKESPTIADQTTVDRLLSIIESQQRTIECLTSNQRTGGK